MRPEDAVRYTEAVKSTNLAKFFGKRPQVVEYPQPSDETVPIREKPAHHSTLILDKSGGRPGPFDRTRTRLLSYGSGESCGNSRRKIR